MLISNDFHSVHGHSLIRISKSCSKWEWANHPIYRTHFPKKDKSLSNIACNMIPRNAGWLTSCCSIISAKCISKTIPAQRAKKAQNWRPKTHWHLQFYTECYSVHSLIYIYDLQRILTDRHPKDDNIRLHFRRAFVGHVFNVHCGWSQMIIIH